MKVAFVVTRFGDEINGGAEHHCKQFVERMKDKWDIEVLTTCALDYYQWENHFPGGRLRHNGYTVNRFPVDHTRPVNTFGNIYNTVINLHLLKKQNLDLNLGTEEHIKAIHRSVHQTPVAHEIFSDRQLIPENYVSGLEEIWMRFQGPVSTAMLNYIEKHESDFDVFFFFSYNYASTFYSIPLVSKKSVLIPTAHEEACLAFDLFKPMFKQVSYFLFNTPAEKNLLERIYPDISEAPGEICGAGIDTIKVPHNSLDIVREYGLKGKDYLVYVGRLDESKGLSRLFRNFLSYRHQHQEPLKLVLLGKCYMDLPNHPDILFPGFVSDQTKHAIVSHAKLFIMPSMFESLSLSLLEAWSLGVPALVNGDCDVLKDHCHLSHGGFYYTDDETFQGLLHQLLKHDQLLKGLGIQGQRYVRKNYTWDEVLHKVEGAAEFISKKNSQAPVSRQWIEGISAPV